MDKTYEQLHLRLEEDHWWFRARRDMLRSILKSQRRDSKILEVGCSGGPLLQMLAGEGFEDVFGIDISESAIRTCHDRGIHSVRQMDASRLTFEDETFDIIIASDTLEHIDDDASAILEWRRVLKPGGIAVIFVPAFRLLWSHHDEVNHHFRRYTKRSLGRVLTPHLRVIRTSYWNFSLFLPAALLRLGRRAMSKVRPPGGKAKEQLFEVHKKVDRFLYLILKAENQLLRFVDLPVGVSVFAVAQKPT